MKVSYLKCLSKGTPSQWAGKTEAGDTIYVHFALGELTISVNDVVKKEIKCGDPQSGVISFEEMIKQGRDMFEWPTVEGMPASESVK